MKSTRHTPPVKLFVCAPENAENSDNRERWISEFGPIDHASSLIPMDDAIHCAFFSFERLIETGQLAKFKKRNPSTDAGFLDNRRAALVRTTHAPHRFELENNVFGEEILRFCNGTIECFPWTQSEYASVIGQDFFLAMRKLYRNQLRTMCLLKR